VLSKLFEKYNPVSGVELEDADAIFEIVFPDTVFEPVKISIPRTFPFPVEFDIRFEMILLFTVFIAP